MKGSGFAVFLVIVLSIWTLMHIYVAWRLSSVAWLLGGAPRRIWIMVLTCLWLSYPAARMLDAWGFRGLVVPLEWLGVLWMGLLFTLFWTVLLVDLLTFGGTLVPALAPKLRGAATVVSVVLAIIGVLQALRQPVVRHYEVTMPDLPAERDGLVLLHISDLHLGNLIGRAWLNRLVGQVQALKPDLIILAGDIIDGNVDHVEPLIPELRQLQAPLGVWAVTGNHEFYAGVEESVSIFRRSGFHVLRDESALVVPGLVMAGVDDLTARTRRSQEGRPIETALAARPNGAVVLVSHSPLMVESAAGSGANLMLSGHTHNGQIWPFNYLVQLRYRYVGGRYDVLGMPLIVCRGTGTWGPRMRLWFPSEMVLIRLRNSAASP